MTPDQQLQLTLARFAKERARFPDGRIDYTGATEAPVLTCFVVWNEKILLLQRSEKVGTYQKLWNAVAGYLDTVGEPLVGRAHAELREELGITPAHIARFVEGTPFKYHDMSVDKTWHIFPCAAFVRERPAITLDWEHVASKWVEPTALSGADVVPGLANTYAHVSAKFAQE